MLSYETPLVGVIKSPYDSKLANRIGSNNKLPKQNMPNKGAASGSTKATSTTNKIGKQIFSVVDT